MFPRNPSFKYIFEKIYWKSGIGVILVIYKSTIKFL